MRIIYAIWIGMCGLGSYAFINMLFLSNADPAIGLFCGAAIFVVFFIFGLFDYSRVLRKKAEEEQRQAEQDRNNELMRQYLEKKLKEDSENEDSELLVSGKSSRMPINIETSADEEPKAVRLR